MASSGEVIKQLRKHTDPSRAKVIASFFKTRKGQYGEGDIFLGLPVLRTREIIKKYPVSDISEIKKLLLSKYHEARLAGTLSLAYLYKTKDEKEKKKIFDFYIANSKLINNWDLVDLSAHHIAGNFLDKKDKKILYKLARSKNLWQRRIAIISTYFYIKKGNKNETFKIAKMLLADQHDLIHKAVGWMLREVGKSCGEEKLEEFLRKNIREMPRTSLRYAIERLSPQKRKKYLSL